MIPEPEQRVIQQRLAAGLAGRVRIDYFTQRPSKVIVPGREDCRSCEEIEAALTDLAALHEKISLSVHEFADALTEVEHLGVKRVPCTVIRGQANRALRYYGAPGGLQFPSLVETIIMSSRTDVPLERESAQALKKLREPLQVSVFVTPTCPYSAAVAAAAYRMGLKNAHVRAEVVELGEFPELLARFEVTATPTTVIDGRVIIRGAVDETELGAMILQASLDDPELITTVEAGASTPLPALEADSRIYVPGHAAGITAPNR